MNAGIVKKETLTCSSCGHVMKLNAWGIPKKHQDDDYMDAIKKSRKRLEKTMNFGIREKNETK